MKEFIVYGRPTPKGRPRMTRNGHAYTPDATRKAESEIRAAFLDAFGMDKVPQDTPVRIVCRFYMPIPQNTSKKMRERMLRDEVKPMKKPDLDNLLKLVLDALNGYAYADDKQVVAVSGWKYYADEGYTNIRILEG